jgi:hypothetical protein
MLKREGRWGTAIGRGAILVSTLATLSACGGLNSTSAREDAPAAAASPKSRRGEIVITGAVNKKYTPQEVAAVKIADSIGINLNEHEDDVCGVSIDFPRDLQPGSYPFGDQLHSLRQMVVVNVSGEYGTFCNEGGSLSDAYQSTQGTLTLTASGAKFSGRFQFDAGQIKDESKRIQVAGSFESVPRP